MAWLEGWRCQGPGRKGRSFVKQISKVTLQRNLFVHTLCVLHVGSVTHCLNFLHFKNHCCYDTVAENVGCKQITVSVMWNGFSLSVWYLPWKPRMKLGLRALHHNDTHPQIPSACTCASPENHILTRGTRSTASPPPTGKRVTQSELFTDDGAAPL